MNRKILLGLGALGAGAAAFLLLTSAAKVDNKVTKTYTAGMPLVEGEPGLGEVVLTGFNYNNDQGYGQFILSWLSNVQAYPMIKGYVFEFYGVYFTVVDFVLHQSVTLEYDLSRPRYTP